MVVDKSGAEGDKGGVKGDKSGVEGDEDGEEPQQKEKPDTKPRRGEPGTRPSPAEENEISEKTGDTMDFMFAVYIFPADLAVWEGGAGADLQPLEGGLA